MHVRAGRVKELNSKPPPDEGEFPESSKYAPKH